MTAKEPRHNYISVRTCKPILRTRRQALADINRIRLNPPGRQCALTMEQAVESGLVARS